MNKLGERERPVAETLSDGDGHGREGDFPPSAAVTEPTMPLDDLLRTAVRNGVEGALADDLQEMVAKETRRALRDHEEQLTAIVRTAVAEAIAALLTPETK